MSEFSMLAKSLKGLYEKNKVTLEKLNTMLNEGKINQKDFSFITGK